MTKWREPEKKGEHYGWMGTAYGMQGSTVPGFTRQAVCLQDAFVCLSNRVFPEINRFHVICFPSSGSCLSASNIDPFGRDDIYVLGCILKPYPFECLGYLTECR